MAKEAYYFSHDANARNDIKVKAMMSKYKLEGYGMFWVLIEMLRETEHHELPLEEYFYLAVQHEFNGSSTDVKRYIDDCINVFKLFESDGDKFWSESLKRRMELKEKKKEQARQAGIKSAEARRGERQPNGRSTDDEQGKERKGKGKLNKIKYAEFVSMTEDEYKKLVSTHGESDTKKMITVLDNYKGSKGKTYKSDYRAILSWVTDKIQSEKPQGRVGIPPSESILGERPKEWDPDDFR